MLRLFSENYHRAKRVVRRLDHATGEINPFLFAVAVGLVVLYISCLVALVIRLPVVHSNACVTTSSPSRSSGAHCIRRCGSVRVLSRHKKLAPALRNNGPLHDLALAGRGEPQSNLTAPRALRI